MAKVTLELEVTDLTAAMLEMVQKKSNRARSHCFSWAVSRNIKDAFEILIKDDGVGDFYRAAKWDEDEDPRAKELNIVLRHVLEVTENYALFAVRSPDEWREAARRELAKWDAEEAEAND